MRGWVYVMSNRSMPNLVKVGFSSKDPELRAKELAHTGTPHPYVVDYEALVRDPNGYSEVFMDSTRAVITFTSTRQDRAGAVIRGALA